MEKASQYRSMIGVMGMDKANAMMNRVRFVKTAAFMTDRKGQVTIMTKLERAVQWLEETISFNVYKSMLDLLPAIENDRCNEIIKNCRVLLDALRKEPCVKCPSPYNDGTYCKYCGRKLPPEGSDT